MQTVQRTCKQFEKKESLNKPFMLILKRFKTFQSAIQDFMASLAMRHVETVVI